MPKTCNQLNTRSVVFLPRCGPGRVFTRSAQGTPRRSKARACRPWGKTVTPVSRLTVRMHPPMHLRMVIPAMGQKSHTGSGPCPGLGARPWQMAAHTIDPEAASPPCTEVPLDYVYRGARWKSRPRSPCTSRSRGLAHDCSPREPPSAPTHGAVGAVFAPAQCLHRRGSTKPQQRECALEDNQPSATRQTVMRRILRSLIDHPDAKEMRGTLSGHDSSRC